MRSKRKSLKDGPLVLALAEVRFPPFLTMNERVPKIQELLRTLGYPGFGERFTFQLQLGGNSSNVNDSIKWVFSDREANSFVVLGTSSITIQTTKYNGFEKFTEIVDSVVKAFNTVAGATDALRVGLRYVNYIDTESGKTLEFYLKAPARTFSPLELGMTALMYNFQISGHTDAGNLVLRLMQIEKGPSLPPDLLGPELEGLSTPSPGLSTILDIDCSSDDQIDLTPDTITRELWKLHEHTNNAFWASVTSDALKLWGETEQAVGDLP